MTTKVFWAGKIGARAVVSIFSNPVGQAGSNVPLNNPTNNLGRVFFDSRFDYLETVISVSFTKFHDLIQPNSSSSSKKGKTGINSPIDGFSTTTVFTHNFGYIPTAMLIDSATNFALPANYFIQNVNNNSFRILSLLADTTNIFLREKYFVRVDSLPSLTKQYKLLVFDNTANIPGFT